MAKMAAAISANDLGAAAIGVGMTLDGLWNLVVEAGPAAAALEFILGTIKRRIAATANESAGVFQVGVFAHEGPLRTFAKDHVFFGRAQFVVLRGFVRYHFLAFPLERRPNPSYTNPSIIFPEFKIGVGRP